MNNLAILHRWRDIVAYAVLAALLAPLFANLDLPVVVKATENTSSAAVLALVSLFALHHWIGFRFQHLTRALRYPPVCVAAMLSITIYACLTGFTGDPWKGPLFYGMFLLAYSALWAWWTSQLTNVSGTAQATASSRPRDLTSLSYEDIAPWIEREEPIASSRQDWFSAAPRARRLAAALSRGTDINAAVIGTFGSGKTSLMQLLQAELNGHNKPTVWVSNVSCWGFQDSAAAQEATLNQILSFLSEKVDCFAIRGLPGNYTKALSKTSSYIEALISATTQPTDPLKQLKTLSPILTAVDARLVVVIEDADRNGARFDIRDIEALLNRFRHVQRLSFIITASPNTQIDFPRLCDHTVHLPDLKPEVVRHIVSIVRANARALYPKDIDPVNRPEQLIKGQSNERLSRWLSGIPGWSDHLAHLVSTPRLLKTMLRRFTIAWGELHGEIDIDELLVLSALRVAAPPAFSFVTRWRDLLRSERPRRGETASENWDKQLRLIQKHWRGVQTTATFDTTAAICLIQAILPRSQDVFDIKSYDKVSAAQSIREHAPTDYWTRAFSEHVFEGELLDQDVLRPIDAANRTDDQVDALACKLFQSDTFAQHFEYFSKFLDEKKLLALNSRLYEQIRKNHQQFASNEANGFMYVWRCTRTKVSQDAIATWLPEELKRSFPRCLRFASDIFHYWAHEFPDAEVKKWRKEVYELFKSHFSGFNGVHLADCFDENFPYTLAHLLLASNEKTELPHTAPSDWNWLGSQLLDSVIQASEKITPQLAVLLNEAPTGPGVPIDFRFNNKTLWELFGTDTPKAVQAFTRSLTINEKLDRTVRAQLKLLPERSKEWLEGHRSNEGGEQNTTPFAQ